MFKSRSHHRSEWPCSSRSQKLSGFQADEVGMCLFKANQAQRSHRVFEGAPNSWAREIQNMPDISHLLVLVSQQTWKEIVFLPISQIHKLKFREIMELIGRYIACQRLSWISSTNLSDTNARLKEVTGNLINCSKEIKLDLMYHVKSWKTFK